MAGANPSTAPATDPVTLSSILATLGLKPNTNNWAQAVLAQGGWPQTPSNINFLQAWAAAEGGSFNNSYTYNVLNTSQSGYGGVVPAGGSFPAFPSWSDGVQATVATLNQTNGDYANITDALAIGNATQQFTQGNLTSAINTWDPGGGDVQTMQENIAAPPVLTSTVTSSGGIASTGAGQFTPGGPVGAPPPGTPASTAASSIMGNCDSQKSYLSWPSQSLPSLGPIGGGSVGGGTIINQCNVKALLSFMLIASGSLLGLIGLVMIFDRSKGKGLMGSIAGKGAELTGAGLVAADAVVPGSAAVGGAMMKVGHHVSQKAAAKRGQAKQQPSLATKTAGAIKQRAVARQQAKQTASQSASQSSSAPPSRPRQHASSAPASRPRQHASSTPSQSQVNSMSPAQKRSLVRQHVSAGGEVAGAF